MKWVKDRVKALGVWFSTDPKVTMEANYSDRLAKVNECLGSWAYRRSSLLGEITVLKGLIASKLVSILSPLPTNRRVLKELSKFFFHFLWSGKRGQNQVECDDRYFIANLAFSDLQLGRVFPANPGLKVNQSVKFPYINFFSLLMFSVV